MELTAPSRDGSAPSRATRVVAKAPTRLPDADLQRRLEPLPGVFDESPEPVAVIDREARLRYVNPAGVELLGAARERLLGRPLADFAVLSSSGRCGPRGGDGASSNPCVLRGHFELRRPDDEVRWVSWSASPLRAADGGGVGAVVFLRDETQRRRDEIRWTRRHDELEQTIRAVAHDLRSPLVSVLGFSRLLGEDFGAALGERGTHYLERIAEAGRTMESLIRELLDFARIGHAGECRMLVDPREVLAQLRGELKPRLDARDVQLDLPEEPPLLHCDRMRLYQLCSNLIGNALDHMGAVEQPAIRVEVCEEGDWHRLTVRDNGRGVPLEERERIFEMFHSIPREGGRKGTGIGLAIVKKIAEMHGGRAWVESAPSGGAAFHVLLPRS